MNFPSLTDAERTALEEMVVHGPTRDLAIPMRGRLALYKLIDETPHGWSITTFGRQALREAPPTNAAGQAARRDEPRAPAPERHYGKKNRNISWMG